MSALDDYEREEAREYREEARREKYASAIRERWLRSKQNRPDEHEGRSEND